MLTLEVVVAVEMLLLKVLVVTLVLKQRFVNALAHYCLLPVFVKLPQQSSRLLHALVRDAYH